MQISYPANCGSVVRTCCESTEYILSKRMKFELHCIYSHMQFHVFMVNGASLLSRN